MTRIAQSKYKNCITYAEGFKFASKKEYERYRTLKKFEYMHEITNLEAQKEMTLMEGFMPKRFTWLGAQTPQQPVKYYADFYYFDKTINCWVLEDVKGFRKDVYLLKRKLILWHLKNDKKWKNTIFREVRTKDEMASHVRLFKDKKSTKMYNKLIWTLEADDD